MNIAGIGTAHPPHSFTIDDRFELTQDFFIGTDQERRVLPVLLERTGVQRRYCCLLKGEEGPLAERQSFFPIVRDTATRPIPTTGQRMRQFAEHSVPLSTKAASAALESAQTPAADITHLVTVSCTGFGAPGVDLQLMQTIGLSPHVQRTNVGFMGCHGGLNGLRVAKAIVAADPQAQVLLCATELCTLHYQYQGRSDQLVANALFADGAMALVGNTQRLNSTQSSDDASPTEQPWQVQDSASLIIPDSADMMSWQIGDLGFEMALSSQLPGLIHATLKDWLDEWLSKHDLQRDQIRGWAVHPGGPRILSAVNETLELPPNALDDSYFVLKNYGNMSSATVFFIIQRMMQAKDRLPCVALGFGPGITVEAALFR